MNTTCPKCGSRSIGDRGLLYYCGNKSTGVYETGTCIKIQRDQLLERIKQLEAVVNDPHALWTNWLRGNVKLPKGIGDVRQYQERIKLMEEALSVVVVSCDHLHHSKKHRHQLGEPCPVVELLKQAKETKP